MKVGEGVCVCEIQLINYVDECKNIIIIVVGAVADDYIGPTKISTQAITLKIQSIDLPEISWIAGHIQQ